jgi:hypothetical protein
LSLFRLVLDGKDMLMDSGKAADRTNEIQFQRNDSQKKFKGLTALTVGGKCFGLEATEEHGTLL